MCPLFCKARAIFGCAWSLVSLIHLKTDRNLLSERELSGSQMCHTCRDELVSGNGFLHFLIPGRQNSWGAISAGQVPKCNRRVSWWKHIWKRAWVWLLASLLHYLHDHHCPGWCGSNCKWGCTRALEACWLETMSSFAQKECHHSATLKSNSVNTIRLPPQPLVKQVNSSSWQRKIWSSHLTEVQGDIHLVVDQSPGEGWALPPPLCPIDGLAHWVRIVWIIGVAEAAVLTLNWHIFGRYKGHI